LHPDASYILLEIGRSTLPHIIKIIPASNLNDVLKNAFETGQKKNSFLNSLEKVLKEIPKIKEKISKPVQG